MTNSKKELVYWSSVVLYGILLVGLLLYLRFPEGKFREFSCNVLEERFPGVNCSIGDAGYGFPLNILFENVQLTDAENPEVLYYEDSLLSFEPSWRNPVRAFALRSSAFGGSHSAVVLMGGENDTIELRDLQIQGLDLGKAKFLQRVLDRNMSGTLDISAAAVLDRQSLAIVSSRGRLTFSEGMLQLKKPILELNAFEIAEGSFDFDMKEKKFEISNGEVINPKLKATFAGNIGQAQPWFAGTLRLQGKMTPQASLFQGKRELKTMVTRMQKRYGDVSLPFKVDGTVGRPAFVFAR